MQRELEKQRGEISKKYEAGGLEPKNVVGKALEQVSLAVGC